MAHVEGFTGGGGGRKLADRDRDPLCGTWLDDRFLIEQRIATGGFGAVYRGKDRDGRPVALKVLHGWLTSDARMIARFRREGATLTQLHSPHTVRTLAVGETADGLLYIAMELLSGESLHDRMLRAPAISWQEAVAIARAVCSALAEAHALGVVHRDLKPANIHLDGPSGAHTVKVLDFGIAKVARGSKVDDGQELTNVGHMVGTCDYMSPEHLTTDECRAPSDIYAVGLVLYEMLTGKRAFPRANNPAAMLATLLTETPTPPSVHANIPDALERIVLRCIERDAEARYAEVGALIDALDAVLDPPATWIDRESPWPTEPAIDDLHDRTPVCDVPFAARSDKTDRVPLPGAQTNLGVGQAGPVTLF
ncbi:MAG TPA: serine/threonine-protein kinase, partial [Kofleriaceae bacterium]